MNTTATVKDTAAAMRKALRAAFPTTKFSVRMATGTAYGWIDVFWTEGPTEAAVNAVTTEFQSSRFSSLDDGYHETGVTAWSCRGVLTHRKISAQAMADARGLVQYSTDGSPFIRVGGTFYTGREAGDLGVSEAVHRFLSATDFTDYE